MRDGRDAASETSTCTTLTIAEGLRPLTERPSLEAVECATRTWVDWFNTRRLLKPVGDAPPAEFEAQCHAKASVA